MENKETKKTKTAKPLDVDAYLKEPVTVTLVKDDLRYTDDVTVTYNGVNYQIKRGIPVQVPRIIQMILEDSFRQKSAAADLSKQLEDNFYFKSERIGRGKRAD